jgi:hypothetical protein
MKNKQILLCVVSSGLLIADHAQALTPFKDNFTGASLNNSRWTVQKIGRGKVAQTSGRVQFTVPSPPTEDDASILRLRNNQPGYNENWEVVMDVGNTVNAGYDVGVGFGISNADDPKDSVNLEFYGKGKGFNFIGITDDADKPNLDISSNPRVASGSMRISFDKTTKLFTFWHDKSGSSNGFQWVKICTFSPTGKGGDRRGNWKMNPAGGRFNVFLFGFSDMKAFGSGQLTLDNFSLRAR